MNTYEKKGTKKQKNVTTEAWALPITLGESQKWRTLPFVTVHKILKEVDLKAMKEELRVSP